MIKVILNVLTTYEHETLYPGNSKDVPEKIAQRWVNSGIAHYPEIRKIQEIKNFTHKPIKKNESTSIIIPVCNCLEYLKLCLGTIIKYTNNYEIIIIDNNSNDETKKYISELTELNQFDLKVIINKENKGFGYGCNQGIKVAKYDYICFLNSDTLVTPEWLYKLQKCFKVNKDCGFTSPTTCYSGGKQCVLSLAPKRFSMSEAEILNYTSSLKEGYVQTEICGFCMLTKKSILDKIGGFDYKRYGIGNSEEIDLEWRAKQLGYPSYWTCGAYVHHFGHMTFREIKMSLMTNLHKNRAIFERRKKDPNLFIENDVEIGTIKEFKIDTTSKITIIIPTYGQEDLIKRCLDSINKNCKLNKEIIIVDDGYGLGNDYGNCRIIHHEDNRGFGAAINTGIRASKYDYIFIINSDVFIQDICLEKMIFALENYADIVGAKLFYSDGRVQHAGVYYITNYMFMHYFQGKPQGGDVPIYCPITGALMGFKRSVIEKIGYFNENFFLAYEDIVFCFRAIKAGLKVLYWPEAKAVHLEGATRITKSNEMAIREQAGRTYFKTLYTEKELEELCKPSPFQ